MTPLARHVGAGIGLAINGAAFCALFTPIRVPTAGTSERA